MPKSIETMDLLRCAVLWTPTGAKTRKGELLFNDPIQIASGEYIRKRQARTSDRTPVAKTVELAVDREIEMGSEVWLGKLKDIPDPRTEVYVVVDYEEIPDIKHRNVRRVVTLERKF